MRIVLSSLATLLISTSAVLTYDYRGLLRFDADRQAAEAADNETSSLDAVLDGATIDAVNECISEIGPKYLTYRSAMAYFIVVSQREAGVLVSLQTKTGFDGSNRNGPARNFLCEFDLSEYGGPLVLIEHAETSD